VIATYRCSVAQARTMTDLQTPPSAVTGLTLTDEGGVFKDVEFLAVPEIARESLAVGLAAMSNSLPVFAQVDTPTGVGEPSCYSIALWTGTTN
jgi:hypothetical protein